MSAPYVIVIACDHGAYEAEKEVIAFLKDFLIPQNIVKSVLDVGPSSASRVDYPDYAARVCKTIQNKEADLGILLCGTGIGMSIAANKFKGIRAAVCHDNYTAKMAREHNNAQVICLGARCTGVEVIKDAIDVFLKTKVAGSDTNHPKRVQMISDIEIKEHIY